MTTIATVNESRFTASAMQMGTDILVRLSGEADTNVRTQLMPFLTTVHGAATASPGATVVVDFKSLKFMSSSCFTNFVVWLGRARNAQEAERYRISFLTSAEHHWQQRSIGALGCFAPDQVVIK
jgi:hypothetical protein